MSVSVPSIAGSFRIGPIASTTLPAIRVSQPFSRAFLCPATHKRSATTPSREATDPRRHSFSRWYLYSYRHWRKYVNPSTNSVGSRSQATQIAIPLSKRAAVAIGYALCPPARKGRRTCSARRSCAGAGSLSLKDRQLLAFDGNTHLPANNPLFHIFGNVRRELC